VLREADDIADATGQAPSTAHLLLAFFTTRNPAERLLRERGLDEDRLLGVVDPARRERVDARREVVDRAAQIAAGCGARAIDTLHVLVAITRAEDTLAWGLLSATGERMGVLRTRALGSLTGAVPRWLEPAARAGEARTDARVSTAARWGRTGLPAAHGGPPSAALSDRDARQRAQATAWTPPVIAQPGSSPRALPASAVHPRAAPRRPEEPPRAERPSSTTDARRAEVARAPTQARLRPEPAREAARVERPAARPNPEPPPPVPEPADEPRGAPDPAAGWLLSPTSYPWLTSLGRNLTAEAARGELDRLVAREREVEALIEILGKRRANNPCLVGEPGVGKTAVVEGLAARLVQEGRDNPLARKILVSLDVGALLVGTHLRGSFSEKLQGLKEEVKRSRGRVIVFFDELHTLVGAGSSGDGPQDAANELKAALARGDFPCIGATTHDEYTAHVERDPALKRRFVPLLIKEPSPPEAVEMLRQLMPEYAAHHGVVYPDEALVAAVNLTGRFITAIAALDLAGSRAARARLEVVTRELVAEVVAERVDLPVERVLGSDRARLLDLEQVLEREVVGHRRQLARIAEVVRRNAAGFSGRRPHGVFLFLGPTGVGKTETAKALARILHGSEDTMIRLDLSEFSEAHAVARLVGAPPGYVGHDAGGQLTEAVRKRPGRVILLDEIEKAHRDVLQLLLQVLDEGRLTDGHGRTVSFAEAVIVMTSNLGADAPQARRRIGFGDEGEDRAELEARTLERAREQLAPELWGRIEDRLVFAPLERAEVKRIARLLAVDSSRRLARERGITYELDDAAVEYLLEQGGFDPDHGARPMRQVLARIVEAPIAARILEGRLHADEHVVVSTRESGALVFMVGDGTTLSQLPRR
jgi:ATP-dependent Clp protease ATP-binding subunit ClpC